MRGSLTEKEALKRGEIILKYIPLGMMLIGIVTGLYINHINGISSFLAPTICGVLAFILAWVWWSIQSVHWKIWAYSRVTNPLRLQQRAENRMLVYRRFHFLEKTQIANKEQRKILQELHDYMISQDMKNEVIDDRLYPDQYVIKRNRLGLIASTVVLVAIGVGIVIESDKEWLPYLIAVALYWIYEVYQRFNAKPIVINEKGINFKGTFYPWQDHDPYQIRYHNIASKELVLEVRTGDEDYQVLEVDSYMDNVWDLEPILDAYYYRFEKNRTA